MIQAVNGEEMAGWTELSVYHNFFPPGYVQVVQESAVSVSTRTAEFERMYTTIA